MKTVRKLLLTGTVGALIPLALYASVQVNGMYNFEDGDPILTQEVNENFQHLAGLINYNDNVAHISVDEVTGNVGIGTSNPQSALDVNGDIRLKTDSANSWVIRSTYHYTNSDLDFNVAGDPKMRINGFGQVCIGYTGPDCTGKNSLVTNRNLGIGTSAPGAALDVVRSGINDPIALFGSTGPTDEQALTVKNGSGGISLFAQGGNGTFLTGATQGDVGIRFTADDDFHIGQERKPLLTIKSGGNVGIGTTNPMGSFQIVAADGSSDIFRAYTSDFVNNVSGSGLYMQTGATSGNTHTNIHAVINGGASGGNLVLNGTGGNVGIGTTTPAYKLEVNGQIHASGGVSVVGNISADDYLSNSDLRLKTDITPLENASEGIACLEGVTYRWNDPASSQDLQIGLIAQDVERCFPEVVTTDAKGYKSVSYARLVAPLIENAKEQQALNASQQLEIARVKADLAATNARLAKLEALLSSRR